MQLSLHVAALADLSPSPRNDSVKTLVRSSPATLKWQDDKIEGNDLERVQDRYDLCTRVSDCLPPTPLRRYVASFPVSIDFPDAYPPAIQRSMEDGDMIDAHLQQACTWPLSPLSPLIGKSI